MMPAWLSRTALAWIGLLLAVMALGCTAERDTNDAPPAPPATDIFQAAYTVQGDSIAIAPPINRTQRTGYDNQPQFTFDGHALLYTSARNGQTDIYRWPLDADAPHPLTATPTSEYSPTPLSDSTYAVVRVEDDGTQRLWKFSMREAAVPATTGTVLLPQIEPVGYFAPVDTTHWALFVLGEPPTLQWTPRSPNADPTVVRRNIGRSIQVHPDGRRISAVQRHADAQDSLLVVRSPEEVKTYAPALDGNGDHVWTPEGYLLMTSGTALYQWHPEAASWRVVHDWAPATPSRIAVSPQGGQLAVVVAPADSS
ncbi:TolB family protein [Longimonas halophila]|nr:hypothetical protein [Longimonas halophila]